FTALPSAATGTFPVTVTGAVGSVSRSATVMLSVNGTPDFQVSVSPGSLSVSPGANGTTTVTVTSLSGFSGFVGLSVGPLPSGVTAAWSPPSVSLSAGGTASATLKLNVATTTVNGSYNLTVAGAVGNTTHTAPLTLAVGVVPDFSL